MARCSKGQCGPSDCSSSSLMKSIPGLGQRAHLRRRLLRVHADARFDNGADERPFVHLRKPARSRNAKLRALIAVEECRRQIEVEQFETRKRFQLEEIAGDRGQKVGERWARIFERPGKRNLRSPPNAVGRVLRRP